MERTCASSSPCRAASIRRSPRRCSPSRVTTSSVCRCSSTIRATGQTSFGSCCSLDDLHDARRVAAAIDIPHYILNFERQFDEQVVSNFVREYAAGPHAASLRALQQRPEVRDARSSAPRGFGADAVATGHYARVERDAATGRYLLRRGVDPSKDQSYFLFSLTQDQLARAVFPVGDRPKDVGARVRAAAPAAGRRQAGQPGDLLRPRRRLRVRSSTKRAPGRGARRRRSSTSTAASLGAPRRHPSLHRRPAQGPRAVAVADRQRRCTCSRSTRRSAGRRRPEGGARADAR